MLYTYVQGCQKWSFQSSVKIKRCLTHSVTECVSEWVSEWQGHLLSCLWTAKNVIPIILTSFPQDGSEPTLLSGNYSHDSTLPESVISMIQVTSCHDKQHIHHRFDFLIITILKGFFLLPNSKGCPLKFLQPVLRPLGLETDEGIEQKKNKKVDEKATEKVVRGTLKKFWI